MLCDVCAGLGSLDADRSYRGLLPVIGALLGHTQPATTARYSHLMDDPLRDATEKVGRLFSGASDGERHEEPDRQWGQTAASPIRSAVFADVPAGGAEMLLGERPGDVL